MRVLHLVQLYMIETGLMVRLMETDPSCVIPLDSAADLVCIDSGSANAQMRGTSNGNASLWNGAAHTSLSRGSSIWLPAFAQGI